MALFKGGEVAIITGASSGIGAGTAVKLAQKGISKLCLTGRSLDALQLTKSKCIEVSERKLSEDDVILIDGDFTSGEFCSRIVCSTVEKFGRIDILVNNAGISPFGPLESIPISTFDDVINTNVRSMVVVTQKCLPLLKKHKGVVINVSSVLGSRPARLACFYCMSKAAIDMFTKCLALKVAPHGVRVNAVNPGVIPTQIITRQGMPPEHYVQMLEQHKLKNPSGKHGEVEDVANVIVFLASKDSCYMNGALLPIDGGWTLNLDQ